MEPPVLEYARAERVGGDRYRSWFLLAGLPAFVGAFVPIGGAGLLAGDMVRTLHEIGRGGLSGDSLFDIAMFTVCLAPLSGMVWRLVRLRGSRPGQVATTIGLAFAGLHLMSILGALCSILVIHGGEAGGVAGIVAGLAVALCGGLIWWNRKRLDLAEWILLMLAGVEMALWALLGLSGVLGGNVWGAVFVSTAAVRGVECWHVVRSRRVVEESA